MTCRAGKTERRVYRMGWGELGANQVAPRAWDGLRDGSWLLLKGAGREEHETVGGASFSQRTNHTSYHCWRQDAHPLRKWQEDFGPGALAQPRWGPDLYLPRLRIGCWQLDGGLSPCLLLPSGQEAGIFFFFFSGASAWHKGTGLQRPSKSLQRNSVSLMTLGWPLLMCKELPLSSLNNTLKYVEWVISHQIFVDNSRMKDKRQKIWEKRKRQLGERQIAQGSGKHLNKHL